MRTVKKSELKPGNIITQEIKLLGRESFKVLDPCDKKNYIKVESRISGIEKKLMLKPDQNVILLHEKLP